MDHIRLMFLQCCEDSKANRLKSMFAELCPDKRIILVDADDFVKAFLKASLSKEIDKFINFYVSMDVLIVSNVHKLDLSQSAKKTLSEISNKMVPAGKWIILTTDNASIDNEELK